MRKYGKPQEFSSTMFFSRVVLLNETSFGIFLSTSYSWEKNRDLTLEAEKLGYDTVYMTDHLTAGRVPRIESLTTLAALSSITEKVRFGEMVLCYAFRNPALLAKIGATIDIISGGRFELGMGAGWCQEEFEAYGYPFLGYKERVSALWEAVTVIRKMWTEESPTFKGDFFCIKDAYCEPKPVQKPHPPIMIGGEGKRTLRVAAEIGDKYNTLRLGIDEFREKVEYLKRRCDESGRDLNDLKITFGFHLNIFPDEEVLMEKMRLAYESQSTSNTFNEWVKDAKDRDLGYIYQSHGRRTYAGTSEQVLRRTKTYMREGASCIMLKFGDQPRGKGMMRLFKKEVMDQINHTP
jgi:alkanesulfonate monooxygenase SsuD/methylene tetrahydromethanopterin reductase-like flavin-dependent oxidoreductase (luciferase family)